MGESLLVYGLSQTLLKCFQRHIVNGCVDIVDLLGPCHPGVSNSSAQQSLSYIQSSVEAIRVLNQLLIFCQLAKGLGTTL